jgi:cytochrome c peroxidase
MLDLVLPMTSAILSLLLWQAAVPPVSSPLPRVPWPRGNTFSQAKADLGRTLFFDPRLSSDGKTSCSTCHVPVRAFGSSRPVPALAGGREGVRHAPSLLNRAYGKSFGWDGRFETVESAIAAHFEPRGLMGLAQEEALNRIRAVSGYPPLFQAAFPGVPPDSLAVRQSLATWIRTLVSTTSAYDRFMAGDRDAMSAAAVRGRDLFQGKANCAACHKPPLFTTEEFACNGAGVANPPDEGRGAITRLERDYRAFRIPSLRDASRGAPYFHDGSVATLDDLVSFYDRGELSENPDPRLKPLRLTEQEKRDLVEFLNALASEKLSFPTDPPVLP